MEENKEKLKPYSVIHYLSGKKILEYKCWRFVPPTTHSKIRVEMPKGEFIELFIDKIDYDYNEKTITIYS